MGDIDGPPMGGWGGGGGGGGADGMVPASHSGTVTFFQMPRWIAKVALYSIKHNHDVQKKLCDLGYRSFSLLELPQTSADDGGEVGQGSIHATTYIRGYNIATQIPTQNAASVPAFQVPDEMRTLATQLSEAFQARAFSDELDDSESDTVKLEHSSAPVESNMSDPSLEESSEEGLADMEEVPNQESVAGAIYIYKYVRMSV